MSDFRSALHPAGEPLFLYSVGYEDQPSLAHWGPGRRDYCILHYVTHGKGWFGGHPVHAGQGFYIHAGQMHEYHADSRDGWNYFWMILSEDLSNQYVLPCITLDENGLFEVDFTGRLLLEAQRVFSVRQPMSHPEALSLFFAVMALHASRPQHLSGLPQAHLSSAKVLIENSFGRRLSVRDVAQEIGIDDRYLYNLFRQYEDVSPKEFISRCSENHARHLLRETSLSITRIAQSLGFDDVCTFSKFFRSRTGLSPRHYRQSPNDAKSPSSHG